jgi:hypothetical protein
VRSDLRLPPKRDLPPGRQAQRKQHLMEEMARTLQVDRGRARRRARPWLAAAAVAGAALGVAVVVPVLRTGLGGAQAEAAEVLRRAARAAEEEAPVASLDGYRYTRSEGAFLSTTADGPAYSVLVPEVREIWVAPDGSGRLLQREEKPIFLGPRDRLRWQESGSPPVGGGRTSEETFGPGGLAYVDLQSLPTDPEALFESIRDRAEGTGVGDVGAEMLVIVGDLLRETVAPPELRAALYEVAARIPGIELVGQVTDPAGRRGVAVAVESDYSGALTRQELIFDPETSEMWAERQVLLEEATWVDVQPPAVIGYAVYLEAGVVDSTQDRP